jgi:RNA polymerase sigma-70 factor (ECF subfamily)
LHAVAFNCRSDCWSDVTLASAQTLEPDDGLLVAAVARRDASAFRTLIDRHAAPVHRLAYRMLGDASEAEDVTQETLLRLWDHAGSWTPQGGGLPAWLRRIASNLCLDRLRRRSRLSDAPPPDRIDDAAGADARFDGQRLSDVAHAALQALSDRQRVAVVLTYYEQMSNQGAAAALGLYLKAFESLLVRARASLRTHIAAAGITAADLGEGV